MDGTTFNILAAGVFVMTWASAMTGYWLGRFRRDCDTVRRAADLLNESYEVTSQPNKAVSYQQQPVDGIECPLCFEPDLIHAPGKGKKAKPQKQFFCIVQGCNQPVSVGSPAICDHCLLAIPKKQKQDLMRKVNNGEMSNVEWFAAVVELAGAIRAKAAMN